MTGVLVMDYGWDLCVFFCGMDDMMDGGSVACGHVFFCVFVSL